MPAFTTATAPMKFWTTFFAAKSAPTRGGSACLKQMQLLPRTGDYTVVLDSDMQPRCITRTTKVEVIPFEGVTADCAAAEGDGTLAAWKKAHRKAFAAACEEIGRNFDESMKCVCEYFDVVYRAVGQ